MSLSKQLSSHTQASGMLNTQTRPHTWSYSGLYAPDPRGRHMFSEQMNASSRASISHPAQILLVSPVILESSSC